jgi:hypothetical protein
VLYVGWNDFQTYDPFVSPPTDSSFDQHYGSARLFVQSAPLKLLAFASAGYSYYSRKAEARKQKRAARNMKLATTDSASLPYRSTPTENYRYFVRSLDRIITAFHNQGSTVRLALCTLVGRWPDGTEADYRSDQGATSWMKRHGLTPMHAAAALERFNGLIRDYAKDRKLVLIDTARDFADLDRAKLQWDFAHLTPEGYELLAEAIYDGLRTAGVVEGPASPRFKSLRSKYLLASDSRNAMQVMEKR